MNYKRKSYLILVSGLMLTLSGCGFHLRGSEDLPSVLRETYVDRGSVSERLVQEVKVVLEAANAHTDNRNNATAIVRLLGEQSSRRVLTVKRTGKAQEFEFHYSYRFELRDAQGKTLMTPQTVSVTRDFLFDATDVVGNRRDAALLEERMMRDAVQIMVRRVRAQVR